jgi:hypothetical protein
MSLSQLKESYMPFNALDDPHDDVSAHIDRWIAKRS